MFIRNGSQSYFMPMLDAAGEGGAGGGTGNGAQGSTGGNGDQGTAGKVTFTPEQQAELDRILGERLSRAEKAAAKKVAEDYAKAQGFENAAAMEAALKAHKEAQDKQKTDAEKALEAKAAAEAKAKAAEERIKAALIKAAFVAEAADKNLVSIEDAFRLADLSKVTVGDDDKVDGMKEAVEALVKDKPYLVKQTGAGGSTAGNPGRTDGAGSTGGGGKGNIVDRILERQGLKKPEGEKKSKFFS